MANKIQIKRGPKARMPKLSLGEFGYSTDTKELYIGDNDGNQKINADTTYATIVIGSSAAGYTVNDVDYLCDGTDDQTEINAAITALPSTGGKIVLLEGTYNLSDTVSLSKTGVQIEGMGYQATIINYTGSSRAMHFTAPSCRISNLTVKKNTEDKAGSGIYITGMNSNLYNVLVRGFGWGVNVTNSTANNYFHFDNLRVENCAKGINLNCKNGTIVSSYVTDCDTGIYIEGGHNHLSDIEVRDCTVGVNVLGNMNRLFDIMISWTSDPDDTKHSLVIAYTAGWNWFIHVICVVKPAEDNSKNLNYWSPDHIKKQGGTVV